MVNSLKFFFFLMSALKIQLFSTLLYVGIILYCGILCRKRIFLFIIRCGILLYFYIYTHRKSAHREMHLRQIIICCSSLFFSFLFNVL